MRGVGNIAIDLACFATAVVLVGRAIENWSANAGSLPFAAAAFFVIALGYMQRRQRRARVASAPVEKPE